MTRIATRLIRDPHTGQHIRVPAHILAPPRIRQSHIDRYGSAEKARAELWGKPAA